jgi:hypothetical protein
MIRRWDSVEAYAAYAAPLVKETKFTYSRSHDWDLGVSGHEAVIRAIEGDPEILGLATKVVDRIQLGAGEQMRMVTELDMAGTRVCVPSYLGGRPDCMARRVRAPRTTPHVSVYVGVCSSCGISADQLLQRGAALVGLLESLQTMQIGVDLYLFADTYGETDCDYYQVIQVESRPLDLSTAAFAIAHPAFGRNVTYGMADVEQKAGGRWPGSHDGSGIGTRYLQHLRDMFGMGPEDILVPSPHCTDPLIANPVEWVNERVQQLTGAP